MHAEHLKGFIAFTYLCLKVDVLAYIYIVCLHACDILYVPINEIYKLMHWTVFQDTLGLALISYPTLDD